MPIRTAFDNASKRNRLVPVYRGDPKKDRVIFLTGHSRKPGSRKNQYFKLREEVPFLLVEGERVRAVYSNEDNDYIPTTVAKERAVARAALEAAKSVENPVVEDTVSERGV